MKIGNVSKLIFAFAVFSILPAAAQQQPQPQPIAQAAPAPAPATPPAIVDAAKATVVTPPAETKPADPETEKLKKALERLQIERDTLQAQNTIAEAKLAQELATRKAELERRKVEIEESANKLNAQAEIAKLKAELERAQLETQISKALVDTQANKLRVLEDAERSRLTQIGFEIEAKEKEHERQNYADNEPVYREDPLEGKTLIMSDRRIPLNDVITMESAEYVTTRINYYNNKSTKYPIFIVIDDSPGGSVMAGYKILKAMESSQAPVHVVVKSYAASMAAVITLCAKRSYAYPNAVLLQHQLRSFFMGNLTEQREELNTTEEWWRRLAGPVATKMGVSLDDLVKKMYARRSTGDWDEFGDEAQKLKWVDVIVEEIRETSLLKNPDLTNPAPGVLAVQPKETAVADRFGLIHTVDQGRPVCILPRVNPHDRWWLYNPDGYYRLP